MSLPTIPELSEALSAAGTAHHEYEQEYLAGKEDRRWAGWYAAYVLGRLGDFIEPSRLAEILEAVEAEKEWSGAAAVAVARELGSS